MTPQATHLQDVYVLRLWGCLICWNLASPTTSLAELLDSLSQRGFTQITFLKMTCPDCFEARQMGVYAQQEISE
jgi:hypothetical protein